VQFALLSDVNAADFVNVSTVPLFRDPSGGRKAWCAMEPGAVKHDTFVFSAAGRRTLFWDTSARSLAAWSSDIRQAVEALGK
jgi:hypothetical protein